MELLLDETGISTFIEDVTDENLKMDLRYLSRRALLLFFEGLGLLGEFAPSDLGKVATMIELCRHILQYV